MYLRAIFSLFYVPEGRDYVPEGRDYVPEGNFDFKNSLLALTGSGIAEKC